MMRFLLVVAGVLGLSVTGFAQQNNTYKVKHSTAEKAPKSVPMGKPSNVGTASARNLQSIEHQTAKSASSHSTEHPAGTASKVKTAPLKDKPNPPIHFGEAGGKKAGTVNQGTNPYQGRLKQKRNQR